MRLGGCNVNIGKNGTAYIPHMSPLPSEQIQVHLVVQLPTGPILCAITKDANQLKTREAAEHVSRPPVFFEMS